jgi:hypothetical protein
MASLYVDRVDEYTQQQQLAERIHKLKYEEGCNLVKLIDQEICNTVKRLAIQYNFDHEEAIRFLNTQPTKQITTPEETTKQITTPEETTKQITTPEETPKQNDTKTIKPSLPLPFDVNKIVTVEQGGCQGLRTNHGLYTQCQNKLINENIYCSVCLKQATKNSHGKPNAGNVADRLACKDLMEYISPDGKRVSSYGKVCQLLSIDQDKAVAEANKFGIVIPDEQWIIKKHHKKNQKKSQHKTAAVTDSSCESETDENINSEKKQKKVRKIKKNETLTDTQLIQELVRQTSTTEIPTVIDDKQEKQEKKRENKSTQQTKSQSKKRENKPKRAPNAYNLFVQDKENRAKYPDVSAKDMLAKLSADWKLLSEVDKKVWKDKSTAIKQQMAVESAPVEEVETTPVEEVEATPVEEVEIAPVEEVEIAPPAPVEVHDQNDKELEQDEYLFSCETEDEEDENEEEVVVETIIHNGDSYYKDTEGLVYDGENNQVGVWDPVTQDIEFLYG